MMSPILKDEGGFILSGASYIKSDEKRFFAHVSTYSYEYLAEKEAARVKGERVPPLESMSVLMLIC